MEPKTCLLVKNFDQLGFMKKSVLLFLLISVTSALFSQTKPTVNSLPNNAYQTGESLKYLLYYGFIDGGHLTAKLETTSFNGQTLYHSKMMAKSIGIADAFFKIEDVYESYFNMTTGLPEKSIRNIHEGKYKQ